MSRYLVISACSYVAPPAEAYRDHVDPPVRDRYEEWVRSVTPEGPLANFDLGDAPAYDTAFLYQLRARLGRRAERATDPLERVAELDEQGVAAEVIFPAFPPAAGVPFGPWHDQMLDAELRRAGARAYNRWLAEFTSRARERLIGMALVIPGSGDQAVVDIEEAARSGLRGVVLPGVWGPPMDGGLPRIGQVDPSFEPIWEACASLGLPVHLLGGTGFTPVREMPGSPLLNQLSRPAAANAAFGLLMLGGVLERHPQLRVVLTDQGTRGIVDLLRRWDATFRSSRFNPAYYQMDRSPWEYWTRQCLVAPAPTRRADCDLAQVLGVTQMMWCSRYPEPVGTWEDPLAELPTLLGGTPANEARLLLGLNAVRAYGLDPAELSSVARRIGPAMVTQQADRVA